MVPTTATAPAAVGSITISIAQVGADALTKYGLRLRAAAGPGLVREILARRTTVAALRPTVSRARGRDPLRDGRLCLLEPRLHQRGGAPSLRIGHPAADARRRATRSSIPVLTPAVAGPIPVVRTGHDDGIMTGLAPA